MTTAQQGSTSSFKPEHNNGTSHPGMMDRVRNAAAGVAIVKLGGGVTLEFKVRYIGATEAARLGMLWNTLLGLIGDARKPDPEDLDGLAAAELEARKLSAEDTHRHLIDAYKQAESVARDVIVSVRDIDDPEIWRPVIWVDDRNQQGDFPEGVKMYMQDIVHETGLMNILTVALNPASEVAGRWRPFLKK